MHIKNYDSVQLIAENNTTKLFITRWGKNIRYSVSESNDFNDLSEVGDYYENKTQFVSNAWDYAITVWGFKDKEVKESLPRNSIISVSDSEKVAINTAIKLLNNSNYDHPDQCMCYLKSLSMKF